MLKIRSENNETNETSEPCIFQQKSMSKTLKYHAEKVHAEKFSRLKISSTKNFSPNLNFAEKFRHEIFRT